MLVLLTFNGFVFHFNVGLLVPHFPLGPRPPFIEEENI